MKVNPVREKEIKPLFFITSQNILIQYCTCAQSNKHVLFTTFFVKLNSLFATTHFILNLILRNSSRRPRAINVHQIVWFDCSKNRIEFSKEKKITRFRRYIVDSCGRTNYEFYYINCRPIVGHVITPTLHVKRQ